jgi:DNA-binding NarL/FixJ family response regulator
VTKLRALIVDDHTLVSQGLEMMVSMMDGLEAVGVVRSGEEALDCLDKQDVDIVLMDVNLGAGISGIETTRRIKERKPDTRALTLTMFTDPATVTQAVKAGANGYLSKAAGRDQVERAIRDVVEGRSVLDPNVPQGVFGRLGDKDASALTDRELDMLQGLGERLSTRELAERFHLSEETVKTYLKVVFRKLAVRDRTEAVAEGFRRGIIH